jgi:hypothetical protein
VIYGAELRLLESLPQMVMGYTIWQEMYLNGVRIGMKKIIIQNPQKIIQQVPFREKLV